MHRLTGKQSKAARGLLKWNIYDFANRLNNIDSRRIESFERGMVHIAEWENDEMIRTYRKEGIRFNDDMEVTLVEADKISLARDRGAGGDAGLIRLGIDNMIIEDSTSKVSAEDASSGDEEDAWKYATD